MESDFNEETFLKLYSCVSQDIYVIDEGRVKFLTIRGFCFHLYKIQYFVLYVMVVTSPLSLYKGPAKVLVQINTSPTCGRQGKPFDGFLQVGLPITTSDVKGKVFMASRTISWRSYKKIS